MKFACTFFDVLELNHFTFLEALLEFCNHCGFSAKHDGVDVAIGFSNHEVDAYKVNVACSDDVSVGSHIKMGLKG